MEPVVGIIGGGNVGRGLAALFYRAGIPAVVYGRAGAICEIGPVYVSQHQAPVEYTRSSTHAGQVNIWICTTKAYDLAAALQQYAEQMDSASVVVSLCNGLVENVFQESARELKIAPHRLRLGICKMGARRDELGVHLSNIAPGAISWGPLVSSAAKFSHIELKLAGAVPAIKLVDDPYPAIRDKWLMNVVINGLCADLRLPCNGALFEHEHHVRAVLTEAYRLGECIWGKWQHSLDEKYAQVRDLIYATRDNENSMYRDVREGRRTEAEFLLGIIPADGNYPLLNRLRVKLALAEKD